MEMWGLWPRMEIYSLFGGAFRNVVPKVQGKEKLEYSPQ